MLIYASNNRKRDNVKIIRIALDLHDVIVDSVIGPLTFSNIYRILNIVAPRVQ